MPPQANLFYLENEKRSKIIKKKIESKKKKKKQFERMNEIKRWLSSLDFLSKNSKNLIKNKKSKIEKMERRDSSERDRN